MFLSSCMCHFRSLECFAPLTYATNSTYPLISFNFITAHENFLLTVYRHSQELLSQCSQIKPRMLSRRNLVLANKSSVCLDKTFSQRVRAQSWYLSFKHRGGWKTSMIKHLPRVYFIPIHWIGVNPILYWIGEEREGRGETSCLHHPLSKRAN